jgi:hypothetical protein
MFFFVKIIILGYWGVTTYTILSFVSIVYRVYIHFGPSMMSQGKNPWKDPGGRGGGLYKFRGDLSCKRCLGRPLRSCKKNLQVFPRGLSLGHH